MFSKPWSGGTAKWSVNGSPHEIQSGMTTSAASQDSTQETKSMQRLPKGSLLMQLQYPWVGIGGGSKTTSIELKLPMVFLAFFPSNAAVKYAICFKGQRAGGEGNTLPFPYWQFSIKDSVSAHAHVHSHTSSVKEVSPVHILIFFSPWWKKQLGNHLQLNHHERWKFKKPLLFCLIPWPAHMGLLRQIVVSVAVCYFWPFKTVKKIPITPPSHKIIFFIWLNSVWMKVTEASTHLANALRGCIINFEFGSTTLKTEKVCNKTKQNLH